MQESSGHCASIRCILSRAGGGAWAARRRIGAATRRRGGAAALRRDGAAAQRDAHV